MSIFNIKNLTVSFKNSNNDVKVLDNLSLNFESKQLVAITGKSGCGKSTFLNVLYGIEKPTFGTILFCGNDISKMNDSQYSYYHSKCVSFIFQHYNLLDNLTALDNVILPLLISGYSRKAAIEKSDAFFAKFGLEKIKNNLARNLSGGEKQRVAIIRAIITDPKVLLCDEPTGALDTINSAIVMDMLKEISMQIVVIFVSHNKEIVKKYSDRIIEIRKGRVTKDTRDPGLIKTTHLYLKNQKLTSKWTNIFVKNYLIENKKRNILTTLSLTFGFASIFLSFGFSNGSKKSLDEALNKNYGLEVATISSIQEYEIGNSPLKYQKTSRPNLDEIIVETSSIESIVFEPNLDYVFNPYPYAKYNGKDINGFQCIPKYNLSFENNLLVEKVQCEPLLTNVVVNEEFCSYLNCKARDILNQEFTINNETTFTSLTNNKDEPYVKDTFSYNLRFKICGVVKEFSFLNSPKVYYSYPLLKEYLSSELLINISRFKKGYVTPYSYIDQSENDDVVSSYSYNLFVTDYNDIKKFGNMINDLPNRSCFHIDSTPFSVRENYEEFMSSFSTTLYAFVAIAFIGVNLILGMSSLSSFIEHKKETAILTCLGAKNNQIQSVYLKTNFLLILLGFCCSILITFLLQLLINFLVNKNYSISNLISVPILSYFNIPGLLPISVLLIALIFSTIFIIIPINFYRHNSVTNELRDE